MSHKSLGERRSSLSGWSVGLFLCESVSTAESVARQRRAHICQAAISQWLGGHLAGQEFLQTRGKATRGDRPTIDQALGIGQAPRSIRRRYAGLNRKAIQRHRERCLGSEAAA
jgi:hypothetical protein